VFECIGDDGDVEFCFFHIEDSEADAIETNGSFFDDEVAEFFGKFKPEFPAAVEIAAMGAGGGGIDVTLDDMSIEPTVHAETLFEVDELACLPLAKGAFFERFADSRDAVVVVADLFDCQTDPVVGEALVDGQFAGKGGSNPEGFIRAFGFDRADLSECFDDSGKHVGEFRNFRDRFSIFRKMDYLCIPKGGIYRYVNY